ncbi:MAG TPA: hypothetical protein PK307_12240 [Spirochaetota bacterium]|nr:hypothetical protein [Spirochaetota bacterium]HOD16899.1 hypothetical protein [Spirochaetota bacterium]HPG50386.1 hypothetical protein [Spirochaetota bacterium]HPN13953.1 hypothetical protein [Spirochaetota bacterium]HQL82966.1 hypothetical protein [Spirochaetota bacterium]
MTLTASGMNLAERIKKAIDDSVITASEYEEIIAAAHEDGMIDHHERILLREFKTLIADRVVERVAG